MPGKNPCLNPLESRKQLLIAESELNRAQLVDEWRAIAAEVRAVAGRAKSFGSIVSSAATLVAGLAAFRRGQPVAAAKSSWLQTLFKGAGLVSSLWLAFRSRDRGQKTNGTTPESQIYVAKR